MAQMVFERLEKKYLVDADQYEALIKKLGGRIVPEKHNEYSIYNLYYDTDDFLLIRKSLEKPVYKEKLRLRSYGRAEEDDRVFLELKKKYKGVVYKRRAKLAYGEALAFAAGESAPDGADRQILKEIGFFLTQNPVTAKVFLAYERQAFTGADDGDLRITFDRDIRFRQTDLRLDAGGWGTHILPPGRQVMEIKATGVMPLWLSAALAELTVYPQSFSKYGSVYKNYIAAHSKRIIGGFISA